MFSELWKGINKCVAAQCIGPPFEGLQYPAFRQLILNQQVTASVRRVLRYLFPTRNINPQLVLVGYMIADYRENADVLDDQPIRDGLHASAFVMARSFDQVLAHLREGRCERCELDKLQADLANFAYDFRLLLPEARVRTHRG